MSGKFDEQQVVEQHLAPSERQDDFSRCGSPLQNGKIEGKLWAESEERVSG